MICLVVFSAFSVIFTNRGRTFYKLQKILNIQMKKKVLMFGWEFPPHNSGGLGTACLGLTEALLKKKTNVTFVLPKKIEGVKSFLKIVSPETPYFRSYSVSSVLSPYINENTYKDALLKGSSIYGRDLFEEVQRYALFGWDISGREIFDVIHAHDWLSFGAGIKAKQRSGKPLIAHIHATEFDRCGGSGVNGRVYDMEKKGMMFADKVIAVSNFTKNIIVNRYGISPEKVSVVHNGVLSQNTESVLEKTGKMKKLKKKIVLYVGRITLQKGPDYFIRAAKRVLDFKKDIFFVIAGSGDMQAQIMREVADMGISDKVLFTGFLRGERLEKMYRMADLFVMPSVSEPFGITPLESLINGTPVLISKQSGSSEVISHALKVDFWDTEEMANKIICALEYPSMSNCLIENGRREALSLTWEKAAEKCINIYDEVTIG